MATNFLERYGPLAGIILALVGAIWILAPERIGVPENTIIVGIILLGVGIYLIGQYGKQ